MSDIYSAPTSSLTEDSADSHFGSVERGIAGDYELDFGSLFGESWESTNGYKGKIWLAILIVFAISFGIQLITGIILGMLLPPLASSLIGQLIITFLTAPLTVGMMLMGVRCAANVEARSASVLDYFDKMVPLFLTSILMYVLVFIGFLLLILPGIYLAVAYYFALPLVAEKNLSPWQALETSRKTITHKWFTVFFATLCISLIIGLSALLLLIPLIWTVPWGIVLVGTIYKKAFGVEQTTMDAN